MMLDVDAIRQDFPILDQKIFDHPLVYLDNGASSQMPQAVIDRVSDYHRHSHANVHRGAHSLSGRSTDLYEAARDKVRDFIHAADRREIIFTSGTTDSLNKVCAMMKQLDWQPGDEILLSVLEHHSNLIPWQQLAKQTGARLRWIPLTDLQELDFEQALKLVNDKTKLLAISHASNVLGTVHPLKPLIRAVQQVGGWTVVDGAQAAPHLAIDVQDLGADFYAFSAHKMCGPTGIGILYGKQQALDFFEPVTYGGEMINRVTFDDSLWKEAPYKFEAGTPNISGAIGLGAAVDYLNTIGMDRIHAHEQAIMEELLPALQEIDGLTLYGPPDVSQRTAIVSFNIDGIHPHDVATVFDAHGVAVRAGHHCCEPLMGELASRSTVRASFYFYNRLKEGQVLLDVIEKTKEFFNYG